MAAAMSTAIGPILGGVLTDTIGWRYIFWLNAPVGVIALLMTYRYLPESRDPDAASIDVPGQTLAMVGLGTLTIVLVEGRTLSPVWTVALAVVAVAGIAAFVRQPAAGEASDAAAGPVPQPQARRRADRDLHDDLRHLRAAAGEQLCLPTTTGRERVGHRVVVPADAADLSGLHPGGQRAGPPHRSAAADDGRLDPDGGRHGGSTPRRDRTAEVWLLELSFVLAGAGLALNTGPAVGLAMSAVPVRRAGSGFRAW